MGLSKRQKELYDFINSFMKSEGYAPSIAEIQKEFSLNSPATVHQHLKNLEEKGLIRREANRHRSIEVVPASGERQRAVMVPILGSIAAGSPIESYSDIETIALPEGMVANDNTYVLKVRGDSMIDDHILDDDMVVVRKASSANKGNTVVALVDGRESTLKRYYPENGKVRLQPANPAMQAMIFNPDQVEIQGIVVGVLRKY